MDWIDLVRWLHVLGACILIGTGAGIAFFMMMAHRTGDAAIIAHTASVVVVADTLFTAPAVILQPLTGAFLAVGLGWPFNEGWLLLSLGLYVFIGLFWLPVVVIQMRLRDEARHAAGQGQGLSPRYRRLFRLWVACGVPAFLAILVLIWLMLARPAMPF